MTSTTNQASEQNINKDIKDSNNSDDKVSENKILPDDTNLDKNYQNTNQVQDKLK